MNVRRSIRRWLLRKLKPCNELALLMSESLERQLLPREWLGLHLHLFVCAWCARYLRQLKYLRAMLRGPAAVVHDATPSLGHEARQRIATKLKSSN
jgi:hypothetical protein